MVSQVHIGKIYKYRLFDDSEGYACVLKIEDLQWDKYVVYYDLSDPDTVWKDSITYLMNRWESVSV